MKSAQHLRLMTYNVHRCVGSDRERDLGRVLDVIAAGNADILGLQEVETPLHRAGDDFLRGLEALGYAVLPGPTLRDRRGGYGNALALRGGWDDLRRLDLSVPGREPRGALSVRSELVPGGLQVITTHLGLHLRERWCQAQRLCRYLMTVAAGPRLLLGDLNDWACGTPTLWPLRRRFSQHRGVRSYPAVRALWRLDRIWFGGAGTLHAAAEVPEPGPARGSDHRAVSACLELPLRSH